MTWNELLKKWKTDETSESVIALTDIAQMKIVLWAFSMIEVEWLPPSVVPEGLSDNKLWNIAWDYVKFNEMELATIANVRAQAAREYMDRLKLVRLAYPDGTINGQARIYIRAYMARKIKEVTKQ